MNGNVKHPGYEWIDFETVKGVAFPCGTTVHVTDISSDAQVHYHKKLTEVYYFLECERDARMQLDDEQIDVRPGICILIRPGTRHRALGKMKVLIVVIPKFDLADEWFD